MDAISALGELAKGAPRGGKYYKRVATGNPKRPWRYFYSEADYHRAMGDGVHLEGEKAKRAHEERKREQALQKMAGTVEAVSAKIAESALPGPIEFQVSKAKEVIAAHIAGLNSLLEELQKVSPPNAKVKGRVKEFESALGKMARKPKYQHCGNLQDVTGTRVVCGSIQEVKDTVNRIKGKYEVIDEDDYITNPQGDYRSHHLIIVHQGQQKEVQVRTGNQDTWGDWFHGMYKPLTPEQEYNAKTHGKYLNRYAKQVADFMYARDTGKRTPPPSMPPCTPTVKYTFGCLKAQ